MAREIKMILSDLDGTLFDDNNRITDEDIKALYRAVDAGIPFVPVTARFENLARHLIDRLPMAEYVVYCNGGSIFNRKTGECIYRDEMRHDTLMELYDYFGTIPCMPAIAINGVCYIDKAIYEKNISKLPLPRGYDMLIEMSVKTDVKELLSSEENHVEVIYTIYPDLDIKAEAWKVITASGELSALGSVPTEHVITNTTATKENIILKTDQIFGVDTKDIMAFGDGDNDSDMLRAAGTGVAMANAMPLALESAEFTTLAVWEGGVAHMINSYLDGKLEGFEYRGKER
ncbi:MAG: HAD family phosphatase [Lachnospiraceae bacterium]|nr:HAD family phosphatase [Lachnospiraceae bacterium]